MVQRFHNTACMYSHVDCRHKPWHRSFLQRFNIDGSTWSAPRPWRRDDTWPCMCTAVEFILCDCLQFNHGHNLIYWGRGVLNLKKSFMPR